MKKHVYIILLLLIPVSLFGQTKEELNQKLVELNSAKDRIESSIGDINWKIEKVKLQIIHSDLIAMGFPTDDELIHHNALSLAYSEKHEQAKWVAHIISPDILKGAVSRTNDFRIDTLVKTGSAVESDYFLKALNDKGDYDYDGFGYDRGHLAPSADFRWSKKALSESYYYSNMSPQLAGFNREKWAELENQLRSYLFRNPESQLYVVTGPIFDGEDRVIERSGNKVAIPSKFFKVALDLENKRAVGFILPHEADIEYPIESFVVSVDEVEKITGFNFFPNSKEEACEATFDPKAWLPDVSKGDVAPISAPTLPRNHFNTVDAKLYMGDGSKINVVGQVVSTRKSQKGNILINIDKQFPNQIFTIFIRKEHIANFPYDPEEYLKGKTIVVKGQINKMGGTPVIYLEGAKQLELYNPK